MINLQRKLILQLVNFPLTLPYNLYCVGGDVKHCTIQSNPSKFLKKAAKTFTLTYICFIVHMALLGEDYNLIRFVRHSLPH